MDDTTLPLSSDSIKMIIASVTHEGHAQLTAIEAERLLNAITRTQTGVPTNPRPQA